MKKSIVYITLTLILTMFLVMGCDKKDEDIDVAATVAAEPEGSKPETSEPQVSEPEVTELEVTEPEVTESSEDTESDALSESNPILKIIRKGENIMNDESYVTGVISRDYINLSEESINDYPKLYDAFSAYNNETQQDYLATLSDFTTTSVGYYNMMTDNYPDNGGFDICHDEYSIIVTRADSEYVSFYTKSMNYWGGANHFENYAVYNYDSKTGANVDVCKVIKDTDAFNEAIRSALCDKYGSLSVLVEQTLSDKDADGNYYFTIFNPEHPEWLKWCLLPDGIEVYFNSDEINIGKDYGMSVKLCFDDFPDVLDGNYKSTGSEYVEYFKPGEYFSADIDNDGSTEKITFNLNRSEDSGAVDEYPNYYITVNGKDYNNYDEQWFFACSPYLVRRSDGYYIYAYVEGYEDIHVDILKFDGKEPKFVKQVDGSALCAHDEPTEDDTFKTDIPVFVNASMLDGSPFDELVIGRYIYIDDDDEYENSAVEIYSIDGRYYIEYLSGYDFGAAEIELLDSEPKTDGGTSVFNVKMYSFSGFAFAGDYMGIGDECTIRVFPGGELTISPGHPMKSEDDLELIRKSDSNVHQVLEIRSFNYEAPQILGSWREAGTDGDNNKYDHYVLFREDGIVYNVYKTEGYPVDLQIGAYSYGNRDGSLSGVIWAERMGYGDQPVDDVQFMYDFDNDILILVDGNGNETELSRTKPGEYGNNIAPGPGLRSDEILEMWKEYTSIDD